MQSPPFFDVCAYCWGPADLKTYRQLTQLNCSMCPSRVTIHQECLTAHKRTRCKGVSSRCKTVSTMTGFNCPRVISKTQEGGNVSCAGKIISTHRLVYKKPEVEAVVPQKYKNRAKPPTSEPGSNAAARLGVRVLNVEKPTTPKEEPVPVPVPVPVPMKKKIKMSELFAIYGGNFAPPPLVEEPCIKEELLDDDERFLQELLALCGIL